MEGPLVSLVLLSWLSGVATMAIVKSVENKDAVVSVYLTLATVALLVFAVLIAVFIEKRVLGC